MKFESIVEMVMDTMPHIPPSFKVSPRDSGPIPRSLDLYLRTIVRKHCGILVEQECRRRLLGRNRAVFRRGNRRVL